MTRGSTTLLQYKNIVHNIGNYIYEYRLLCSIAITIIMVLPAFGQAGYVGESVYLSAPSVPGTIGGAAWTCSSNHVSVSGNHYGANVRIDSYFAGSVTVSCQYSYSYYVGTKKEYGKGTAYYSVSCYKSTLTLDKKIIKLKLGEESTLTYSNSSGYDLLFATWTTSDKDIATVDYGESVHGTKTITVSAVKPGECTIKCEGNTGNPAPTCKVIVEANSPTSVSISPSNVSVDIEQSTYVNAEMTPSNAVSKLIWWSDDENIATVDNTGKITGISEGRTKVWVRAEEGGFEAYCTVDVTVPKLSFVSSIPNNKDVEVDTKANISAEFSFDISKGKNYSMISLVNTKTGKEVEGQTEINGNSLKFIPSEELESQVQYIFSMPTNAVKNKWGAGNDEDISIIFTTSTRPADVLYLLLWNHDGSKTSIRLAEHPNIQFDTVNKTILCTTRKREIEFHMEDLYKYTLEVEDKGTSGINAPHNTTEKAFCMNDNTITISGCKLGSVVKIYKIDGKLIETYKTDNNGAISVPTDNWNQGVYVIKNGSITYKIMKK
ncbi:MAG: Ig-like domain-containing protein [Prevotella sp.]|nr:Ig-like domain-containing protein [Prevotella sp.]